MALPQGVVNLATYRPQSSIGAAGQSSPGFYDFENERSRTQGAIKRALLGEQQKFQGGQNAADRANQVARDQIGADAAIRQTQIGADTNRRGQDLTFQASNYGNELGAQTAQRGQDLNFRATTEGNQLAADTTKRGQDFSLQASLAPVNAQMDRFNRVFPSLQEAIMGTTQGGGPEVTAPTYDVGPSMANYTQMSVNDARARNAATAESAKRTAMQSAGARGISGSSPIMQALLGQMDVGRMIADSNDVREIGRADAEQAANNQYRAGTLNSAAWAAAQRENTARQATKANQVSALMAALAGLV